MSKWQWFHGVVAETPILKKKKHDVPLFVYFMYLAFKKGGYSHLKR